MPPPKNGERPYPAPPKTQFLGPIFGPIFVFSGAGGASGLAMDRHSHTQPSLLTHLNLSPTLNLTPGMPSPNSHHHLNHQPLF